MAMFKVSPAVQPKNQKFSTTCWLTCLEMMFQWKNDRGDASKKKWEICSLIDQKTDYWAEDLSNLGIAPIECRQVAQALGLQPTGAGDYTPEILHDIVSKKGPAWVAGMWIPGLSHAVLVTGCKPANGKITIIDPYKNWDLTESDRTVSWINARGSIWKSYEGSVMYWK
jgi:hypothetical protein